MQRKHDDAGHRAEVAFHRTDLAGAGQERKNITIALGEGQPDRLGDRPRLELRRGRAQPARGHGKGAPRHLDHGRVAQQFGHGAGVDSGRHHEQPQVVA
ncbi:unannotated protein [freshwater metagenome]|uniref:Unannotated protein n=1 Tax=freshwater metagenome TaxID=449393 RepID=A0A6J7IL82_9ZZZZ